MIDRLPPSVQSALLHPVGGPALRLLAGYVVLIEVGVQLFFGRIDIPLLDIGFLEVGTADRPIPREVFLLGAVLGSLYALIGMGLILVHKANRIINFAQAQLGAVPAVLALLLVAIKGWSYWLVLPIVIGGAVLLGAGVERTVIRRFRTAPRLILTVATIGVGFLLLFGEYLVKLWVSGDLLQTAATDFPTPWQGFSFRIGTAVVSGDHIFTVVVVALCMAGLAAFFRYTDTGVAVRAVAENADRAALAGVPVKRLSTVVWVIAAVLSAIGVFLRAPILSLPLTGFTGPEVLLFGLAAAVMARFDRFGACLAAGMFIGVVDRAALFGTSSASLANASMLVVILGALVLQRRLLSRAFDTGVSSWQAVKELRPVPPVLRDVPEVRRAGRIVRLVVIAGLVAAPFAVGEFQTGLLTQMVVYAMVGVSLVILTGWCGQISLGQWAISGIGAAVGGGLAANHNLDFFVVLAAAGLAGALAAVVVGLPALRIQGLLLAVTTLAFASTVHSYVLRDTYFGWLLPDDSKFVELPALYGAFDLSTDTSWGFVTIHAPAKLYFVTLVFLGLAMAVARSLRRTRSGRIFIGVRDNGRAMEALGVGLARSRLTAFAISGAIAGVAGALFAYQQSSVDAVAFRPEESVLIFAMTVIGGIASLPGAVIGAVFVKGVPLLPVIGDISNIDLLSSGAGLLAVLVLVPGGLAEALYRLRDRWLRRVADRRGIHVPSLVADSVVVPDDDEPHEVVHAAPGGDVDDPLLTVRGLEVAYDRVQVLFGVDLDVGRGETVALLGTNGAGKSTVLNTICGLVAPLSGTVTYDGAEITGAEPIDCVEAGIVVVPGGKAVFPTLSVAEHLRVAGWLYRKDPQTLAQSTERALDLFPRLRERREQLAGELSGGEQQMLALAMAFIAQPRLLIIDELSLGLAPTVVEQLVEVVRRIQESGTSVIIVEQSINVALTLAERAYFLEKGEVRFSGRTADLLERDDIARSVFLAGAADTVGSATADVVVEVEASSDTEAEPVLAVDQLSVHFGGIRAVDGCSFALHRGETLGIIGANGAGKTTLFDLISGFLAPDGGTIALDGTVISDLPPPARAWLGLGRSFQDARLLPSLTVAENIAVALERHIPERDHVAAALGLPGVAEVERDIAWTVGDLVELLGLEAYRDKLVRELSTGTRRIVDLAMCIAHEPKVLLLDEPSSGIAQRETEALAPVLGRIKEETGCSLLVIEHDMPLITSVSDRLLALELGHPLAVGTPQEVLDHPDVQASYLGGDPAAIGRSGRRTSPTPRRARAAIGGRPR